MLKFLRCIFIEKKRGQAIIEFSFSMIVVLLMGFALMKIFSYMGVDYVGRKNAYDAGYSVRVPRVPTPPPIPDIDTDDDEMWAHAGVPLPPSAFESVPFTGRGTAIAKGFDVQLKGVYYKPVLLNAVYGD